LNVYLIKNEKRLPAPVLRHGKRFLFIRNKEAAALSCGINIFFRFQRIHFSGTLQICKDKTSSFAVLANLLLSRVKMPAKAAKNKLQRKDGEQRSVLKLLDCAYMKCIKKLQYRQMKNGTGTSNVKQLYSTPLK
jgi:hypothetical protein